MPPGALELTSNTLLTFHSGIYFSTIVLPVAHKTAVSKQHFVRQRGDSGQNTALHKRG